MRLTKKYKGINNPKKTYYKFIENCTMLEIAWKLGQHEDIEEELGIGLLTLYKAEKNGFYYKNNDNINFCRNCIRVDKFLIETKPCYQVKETTLKSCYYGDVEDFKNVEDAHYWSWKISLNVNIKDYGKTWALTKEELK